MKTKRKRHFGYMAKNWRDWDFWGMVLSFLRIPVAVLFPAITAALPAAIIWGIEANVYVTTMIAIVGALTGALVLVSWIDPYIRGREYASSRLVNMRYQMLLFNTLLHLDYTMLESIDGREKLQRARIFSGGTFGRALAGLVVSAVGIITYATLLTVVHPLLLVAIFTTSVFEFFLAYRQNKIWEKGWDGYKHEHNRREYFYNIAVNPAVGKDIRLSGLGDWFMLYWAKITAGYAKIWGVATKNTLKVSSLRATLVLIRDAASYGFLIWMVVAGNLGAAEFVFLISMVLGFSAWLTQMSLQVDSIRQLDRECEKYLGFINLAGGASTGGISAPADVFNITFDNVGFAYSDSDDGFALKATSFTVKKGDRIAIVGENGAGKTTLIKLLAGLYKPTTGKILVNDVATDEFCRDEYFKLFSVLFQDYYFLPVGIDENIAMLPREQIDKEKLAQVLAVADLDEKIKSLPDGITSPIVKDVHKNAVDFSGGQRQRLLLARAIYKDAPVLILDEPTAALDALAEEAIYKKYTHVTSSKISFFISHRLASTRFCDLIFYMKNGAISEVGAHDELLAKKGDYWRMFSVQSHYYNATKEDKNG